MEIFQFSLKSVFFLKPLDFLIKKEYITLNFKAV
jgi:hypothetical protein